MIRSFRNALAPPPRASVAGPLVAGFGLVMLAVLTGGLFSGQLPFLPTGGGNHGVPGQPIGADPNRTPAPSNEVVVASAPDIPGAFVFAKKGNVWLESQGAARQLTSSGHAGMPSWSPDGRWIYYIETLAGRGYYPNVGAQPVFYAMTYPVLWRIHPDGSGAQRLTDGIYHPGPRGSWTWFYWLRQPVASPDGHTIALVSDAPDPSRGDVVLQFFDTKTGRLTKPALPEEAPLGHQDPTWRPDGNQVAYVYESRDGTRGTPALVTYDPHSGRTRPLTGPGYSNPSYSPDGRYLAATRTSGLGTNVVILDAQTGAEILALTNDDQSWDPVWSPAGDMIAFLHLSYQTVDLRVVPLTGPAGRWVLGTSQDITQYSGLDGASRPGWYIAPGSYAPPAAGSAGTNAHS